MADNFKDEKKPKNCYKCPHSTVGGNCKKTGRYVGGYFELDFPPAFCPLEKDEAK